MLLSEQQAVEMRKLAASRPRRKASVATRDETGFARRLANAQLGAVGLPDGKAGATAKGRDAGLGEIREGVTMPTYELDFYAWLNRQAQVLRSRESESLDWDHLTEEIEAMAAGEKRGAHQPLLPAGIFVRLPNRSEPKSSGAQNCLIEVLSASATVMTGCPSQTVPRLRCAPRGQPRPSPAACRSLRPSPDSSSLRIEDQHQVVVAES